MLLDMQPKFWEAGLFLNSSEVTPNLHFIVNGRIKVFQINPHTGREHTIFILSRGNIFDILYFLESLPHDVYWETLDELEILNIHPEKLRSWMIQYPILNASVIRYLGGRMRQLEDVASDISLHSTLIRLTNLILKNLDAKSHRLKLINNLPNDEIAGLIGTTRAVVNRHIQELKRCGAISVSRKHIDVENLEMLLAISEEKFIP